MNSTDPAYNDLSQLLSSFETITLEEMDGVKLLDRVDIKFAFNYNRLPLILNGLQEHYKILDVNGVKQNSYETLYFDTPDFKLYHDHHNCRANRYKVRYRKYVESNLKFFEVKYRNNKGRTVKCRVRRKNINEVIEGKSTELINEKTPFVSEDLESKLWVNYSRVTLVNKTKIERLTFDIGLQLITREREFSYQNLVIAEVKQEKTSASPFLNIMRKQHIREGSISKYCLGVVSLFEGIKKNGFKPKLLILNKACHETNL